MPVIFVDAERLLIDPRAGPEIKSLLNLAARSAAPNGPSGQLGNPGKKSPVLQYAAAGKRFGQAFKIHPAQFRQDLQKRFRLG